MAKYDMQCQCRLGTGHDKWVHEHSSAKHHPVQEAAKAQGIHSLNTGTYTALSGTKSI
jgi:hypothetical protein